MSYADPTTEEYEDYISSYYGACLIDNRCHCSLGSLEHKGCPNWKPTEAKNWNELIILMKGK